MIRCPPGAEQSRARSGFHRQAATRPALADLAEIGAADGVECPASSVPWIESILQICRHRSHGTGDRAIRSGVFPRAHRLPHGPCPVKVERSDGGIRLQPAPGRRSTGDICRARVDRRPPSRRLCQCPFEQGEFARMAVRHTAGTDSRCRKLAPYSGSSDARTMATRILTQRDETSSPSNACSTGRCRRAPR